MPFWICQFCLLELFRRHFHFILLQYVYGEKYWLVYRVLWDFEGPHCRHLNYFRSTLSLLEPIQLLLDCQVRTFQIEFLSSYTFWRNGRARPVIGPFSSRVKAFWLEAQLFQWLLYFQISKVKEFLVQKHLEGVEWFHQLQQILWLSFGHL